ncbi:hypothetical protein KCP73_03720 [Salmonella enterica subsp. enterica]|nr:hypothetical protein KCP73_03720 [Salmonella enterica subsp. enterica]
MSSRRAQPFTMQPMLPSSATQFSSSLCRPRFTRGLFLETERAFRADPAGGTARCRQRPACRVEQIRSPCLAITSGLISISAVALWRKMVKRSHKDFCELPTSFTFQTQFGTPVPVPRDTASGRSADRARLADHQMRVSSRKPFDLWPPPR